MITPFSNKCAILAQALADWEGDEKWKPVFAKYNLGYYFSFGVAYNLITVSDEGKTYIEDAWNNLCDTLGVDSYGDYDNLEEVVLIAESE